MKSMINYLRTLLTLALIAIGFTSFAATAHHTRAKFSDTTIYVRLETGPDTYHLNDDWDYHEVYDYYVRFYQDVNCTIPAILPSDMTVEMQANHTLYLWSGGVYTNNGSGYLYGTSGDSQIEIGDLYVELRNNNPYEDYTSSYYLTGNTTGGSATLHYVVIH